MKQRNKKFLQRIMALMLSIVLASSSINALAFNSDGATSVGSVTNKTGDANPAGASGNGTGASYDFDIKSFADTSQCISSRAYLITIQKLENHALLSDKLSPEYTSAKASIGEDLTQVAFSSAYEYLTKYPACFSSATLLSSGLTSYALVGVKDNNGITGTAALPGGTIKYNAANGYMSSDNFQHVYIRSTPKMGSVSSSWKPTDLTRSSLLANEALYTKFLDGQLTIGDIKPLINTGNMSAAIENVIKPLADSGHLTAAMNGDWTKEKLNGNSMYKFYLLDYLLAINEMCGSAYDSLINEYLATLNCDGFESFVVPMIAVCQIYRVNDSTYACSTLPDMLGIANNGSYVEIPNSLNGSVGYTTSNPENSSSSAQMEWSHKLMDSIVSSRFAVFFASTIR